MIEIKPIGKFHTIDRDGFIENSAIVPILQVEYQEPIDIAIKSLLFHFTDIILSIYIRGSVAKGIAIPYISDIDLIILTSRNRTEEDKKILYQEISPKICTQFPFIYQNIEMHFQSLESLSNPKTQFLFKTQCGCIYGKDIIPNLPKFKVDQNAISHAFTLQADLDDTDADLHTCSWIMKRIVRVGFEICMMRANTFTRDLYPCYQVFGEYYPHKEKEMRKALELAIQPRKIDEEIKKYLNDFGKFLIQEVNIHLSNPANFVKK